MEFQITLGFWSLAYWWILKAVVPWSFIDEIGIQEEQASGNATQVMAEKKPVIYNRGEASPQEAGQFRNLWENFSLLLL